MPLVATYGNLSAFNISVYDMSGGGYYAVLNDGGAAVLQRRNSGVGQDTYVTGGVSSSWLLDHFASYSFNSSTNTLTFSGASDVVGGVTFTRQETYKFLDGYVVEDTWQITTNSSGQVNLNNWNYYTADNAAWDLGTTNMGAADSYLPLGIGIQLVANGPVYGVIPDNNYKSRNCFHKRYNAAGKRISASSAPHTWLAPGDSGAITVVPGTPFSLKQWFFKSANTQYDFQLKAQMAIALAKGYSGGLWEKLLRVTAYNNQGLMDDLVGFKSLASFSFSVSDPGFLAEWMRDSWWQSLAVDDAAEQNAISVWEQYPNISGNGQLPTRLKGDGVTIQYQGDESTLLYIIRAYYDKTVRGLTVNNTVVTNAWSYIVSRVVSDWYEAPLIGWDDIWAFNAPQSSYNQGLYCVALKCAKAFGLAVTNTQITNAIANYASLYNAGGKFIAVTNDVHGSTVMGPDALSGEAISLLIFGQPMLSDTVVTNHVITLHTKAMTAYGMKDIANSDGTYCDPSLFQGASGTQGLDNGGNKYLYEHLAYYSAFHHGLAAARGWATTAQGLLTVNSPVVKEYVETSVLNPQYGDASTGQYVFSWHTGAVAFVIPQSNNPVTLFYPEIWQKAFTK